MDYLGISVAEQTAIFFYAVGLGAGLSVVYDIFRIVRIAFGGRRVAVFFEDVLFSLVALVSTFIFVISFNNGQLRFFVLLGELIGFLAYRFTFGRLVLGLSKVIINTVKRVFSLVFTPLVKLLKIITSKFKSKKEKTAETPEKSEKTT